jgi:TetR/AcrR family transcriptional regulator, acrAB operon repressor
MRPPSARSRGDGEATRANLINAARAVFQRVGVNGCGLDQIANEAGVTRGAVYWHFANKADLFFAMLQQVRLTLVRLLDGEAADELPEDPLARLERQLQGVFRTLQRDVAAREVLEILFFRCEYVGPFAVVQDTLRLIRQECVARIAQAYVQAEARGQLRAGLTPQGAALDTLHFVSSLLKTWLADPASCSPEAEDGAIACHLALRQRAESLSCVTD